MPGILPEGEREAGAAQVSSGVLGSFAKAA